MTPHVATRTADPRSSASRRVRRPVRDRADQTASWPAILAWGSGLIVTALGAGALIGNDLTPAGIRILGAPLAVAGLAIIAWGTASLSRGAVVLPRAILVLTALGLVLTVSAFLVDPVGTSVGAVAAASVLLLALAMTVLARRRRAAGSARTGIVGILVAAVVVAALTGPALTAASAARLTQGNAGVPVVVPGHH